jgi:hypothetical protein
LPDRFNRNSALEKLNFVAVDCGISTLIADICEKISLSFHFRNYYAGYFAITALPDYIKSECRLPQLNLIYAAVPAQHGPTNRACAKEAVKGSHLKAVLRASLQKVPEYTKAHLVLYATEAQRRTEKDHK